MKIDEKLNIYKRQYLLLIVSGFLAVIASAFEQIIPEGNFYVSCNWSIFSVIICYGIISIWFLKETGSEIFIIKRKDVLAVGLISLCVVFLCYFFQNAIFNLLYVICGYIPEKYICLVENVMYEENNYSTIERIVLIFSFGIVIPFFEELFFRFIMLESFVNVSLIIRFVLANACFVLVHDNIELMIFTIPLSIVCSLLIYRKRCFIYPFLIHCIVNIVGIMEIPLDEITFSPKYPIQYGEKLVALTNVFFNLVVVAFIVILLYVILKEEKQNSKKDVIFNRKKTDDLPYIFSVGVYFVLRYLFG